MIPSKIEQAYQELLLLAKYYNTKVRENLDNSIKRVHGNLHKSGRYLRSYKKGEAFKRGKWEWMQCINIYRPVKKSVDALAVFAHELGHAIIRSKMSNVEYDERCSLYNSDKKTQQQEEHEAWLHADGIAEKLGFYNNIYIARREESLTSYGLSTK